MRFSGRERRRKKTGVSYRKQSADESRQSMDKFSRLASASGFRPSVHIDGPMGSRKQSNDLSADDFQRLFETATPTSKQFESASMHLEYPKDAPVPKKHKAKILVWSDLTVDAVDRLNESLNAEYVKSVLADIFVLDNWKEDLKTGIVMDLYYYTLQFAREQNFSKEKTSTFFSIIKEIFQVCIETPFGNLDHTFLYFKDLLHCHAVNHPPYSIELFSPLEVRKISEYTVNTFFRHFKMYKYAFTSRILLDVNLSYEGMNVPELIEVAAEEPKTPEKDSEAEQEVENEEDNEEVLKAKEELRNLVKHILTEEAKKIEGKVEDQVNSAVAALNTKIDPYVSTTTGRQETKGRKK